MANRIDNVGTVFIGPTGSFVNLNAASLEYPGQLGAKVTVDDKTYQLVKTSTGAATPAPTAGVVAFWNDRSSFVVSDLGDSESGRDGVAGVHLGTVTAGRYCWIQVGGEATVLAASGVGATNSLAIAKSGNNGDIVALVYGTAGNPIFKPLGVIITGATGSGTATVDIQLENN